MKNPVHINMDLVRALDFKKLDHDFIFYFYHFRLLKIYGSVLDNCITDRFVVILFLVVN